MVGLIESTSAGSYRCTGDSRRPLSSSAHKESSSNKTAQDLHEYQTIHSPRVPTIRARLSQRRIIMRSLTLAAAFLSLLSSTLCASEANLTEPLTSRQILPSNFKPPQVFQNVNLLRNINVEKGYVRETVNVVIENVDSKPQDEYYLPFEAELVEKVGGMQVRDKKNPEKGLLHAEVVEYDTYRSASRRPSNYTTTRLKQYLAVLPSSTALPSPPRSPPKPNKRSA